MYQKKREKVQVHLEYPPRPYIMVPVDQLALVREALDRNGVGYWVEAAAYSINHGPSVAFINLERSADPTAVQVILDNAGTKEW